MPEHTELELAWAAGFFDGEGTTRFRDGHTFTLQIAQVHKEPLERFRSAVSAGKIYGPYRARTPTKQPYYVFSVSGLAAQKAYGEIRQYLSSIKLAQADSALQAYLLRSKFFRITECRLAEIRAALGSHEDPLIGSTRANGRAYSKSVSFADKYAAQFGLTRGGLARVARDIELGLR